MQSIVFITCAFTMINELDCRRKLRIVFAIWHQPYVREWSVVIHLSKKDCVKITTARRQTQRCELVTVGFIAKLMTVNILCLLK